MIVRMICYAMLTSVVVLVSGCTTMSLEELRHTTPDGSAFQKALAQRYMDFAIREADDYDWIDSMHFADKGLLAAYGKDTSPEDLGDWHLSQHTLADMEKRRGLLIEALTEKAIAEKPEIAADAQFYFDCLVEQQEENWQDDDIAHCRDGFAVAMQKLAGHYREEEPKAADISEPPVTAPVLTSAVSGKETDVIAYVVFFEWNQSVLSAQGKKVTNEVIALLKDQDRYEVVLNGHSDTAESVAGDFSLSQRRAEAVKQRLVEGGIKEAAIKAFAFGSSDPHIKTGNGVKEPANRRVEIYLND